MQKQIFVMVSVLMLVLLPGLARSHEIRPSIVDLNLVDGGKYELVIRTNAEAILAGVGSEHEDTDQSPQAQKYNELRAMAPEELQQKFDGFAPQLLKLISLSFDEVRSEPSSARIEVPEIGDLDLARDSIIRIDGLVPQNAQKFQWKWDSALGASVIRLNGLEPKAEDGYSAYIAAGEASEQVLLANAPAQNFRSVVTNYIVIGFTHILPKGLDHILFVVGLFLLSTRLAPLLWQITAFTVAHTVSLALGILGYVNVSPAIVEPLIAASIVYVAVENILTDKLQKWRPFVVFGFGLLHGLGFAGVLKEIGMSPSHFVTSLISFNVGVELGQLSVIAICFATVGYWFGKKQWYRGLITTPASLCIAVIASWWVYERVFLG